MGCIMFPDIFILCIFNVVKITFKYSITVLIPLVNEIFSYDINLKIVITSKCGAFSPFQFFQLAENNIILNYLFIASDTQNLVDRRVMKGTSKNADF